MARCSGRPSQSASGKGAYCWPCRVRPWEPSLAPHTSARCGPLVRPRSLCRRPCCSWTSSRPSSHSCRPG
eukprot:7184857-Lingulodinium_polyedra.AAC.1